ncbi:MAG: hypothetical protein AAF968_08665, partial [Pseudomonadota bacterium]
MAQDAGSSDVYKKDYKRDLGITEFRIGLLGGENATDRMRSNECLRQYVEDLLGVETKLFAPADYDGVILDAQTLKDVAGVVDLGGRIQVQQRAQRAMPVQRAVQHVRYHVHPRHQVELLEDHRAIGLPGAHRRPFEPQDIAPLPLNPPRGRGRQ